MLAFELVVMREVSKSNLCFEITLVSFPPEFHFIQYKKKNQPWTSTVFNSSSASPYKFIEVLCS